MILTLMIASHDTMVNMVYMSACATKGQIDAWDEQRQYHYTPNHARWFKLQSVLNLVTNCFENFEKGLVDNKNNEIKWSMCNNFKPSFKHVMSQIEKFSIGNIWRVSYSLSIGSWITLIGHRKQHEASKTNLSVVLRRPTTEDTAHRWWICTINSALAYTMPSLQAIDSTINNTPASVTQSIMPLPMRHRRSRHSMVHWTESPMSVFTVIFQETNMVN